MTCARIGSLFECQCRFSPRCLHVNDVVGRQSMKKHLRTPDNSTTCASVARAHGPAREIGIMLSDSFYADMQERGNATFPCTPSPKPTTTPNKNRLAARTGKKLGCGNDARWNPWKSPIPTSSPLLPALGNPATDAGCPHSHSHNDDGLQKTEPTSNQTPTTKPRSFAQKG